MSLVTLNKNSECKFGCGRKNCANPGWPSWMSYACLETALGIARSERDAQKARADLSAIETAAIGSQMLDLQQECIAQRKRADAALGMAAKEILAAFDDACWDGLAERVRTGQWTVV